MRYLKGITIFITALLLLSISGVAIFYPRIAAFTIAANNELAISYKRVIAAGLTELMFKDLKAVWPHQGFGLSASDASIKLVFNNPLDTTTDFSLNDVHFIKEGAVEGLSYGSIEGLIALPFGNSWRYRTLSGKIRTTKDAIVLKDFIASGDVIKFSIDGKLTGKDTIIADVTIYFEKSLSGRIPAELSNMMLKDENDGWKSLILRVEGDITKPSIRLTGKLFRLNIGVKPSGG